MSMLINKYKEKLLLIPSPVSIGYLLMSLALLWQLYQLKQFPIRARENINLYSCNFDSEQLNFYQEKISLVEKEINKVSGLDIFLIAPYLYKMHLNNIDSETVLAPASIINIDSEVVQVKKYSLGNMFTVINQRLRNDLSGSSLKKCN